MNNWVTIPPDPLLVGVEG